jgi:hypothetical protein
LTADWVEMGGFPQSFGYAGNPGEFWTLKDRGATPDEVCMHGFSDRYV